MFKNAIVRKPAKSISSGITSSKELGEVDYLNTLNQHNEYIKALQKCGLKVEILDSKDDLPDSCFMEDVAICTKKFAIITNLAKNSRKQEIEGIREVLSKYYKNIEQIKPPATLEGGDVMMVGDHFYIGLSDRTNEQGAKQFIEILQKYNFSGSTIDLKKTLHLKTGITYIQNNTVLISGEFKNMSQFDKFDKIEIDEDEQYCANCIRVNEYVIVPKNFPKSKKLIESKGFKTIEVDTSEFRKIDGGLTCLSLRF